MISTEYVAGWFDGEGCIHVSEDKYTSTLHVIVGQAYRPILEEVLLKYGGHISKERSRENHKTIWQWSCKSKLAEAFLADIYPFLHEKKKQAWLALEFRAQCFVVQHGPYRPVTDEEHALRRGFALAIKLEKSQ